jgi:hypothetical protein
MHDIHQHPLSGCSRYCIACCYWGNSEFYRIARAENSCETVQKVEWHGLAICLSPGTKTGAFILWRQATWLRLMRFDQLNEPKLNQ